MRDPSRSAESTCEKSFVRVIHIRRWKRTSILVIDAIIGLRSAYISTCPVEYTPQPILLDLPATDMRSKRASPSVRRNNFVLFNPKLRSLRRARVLEATPIDISWLFWTASRMYVRNSSCGQSARSQPALVERELCHSVVAFVCASGS
jgi:hypothetical protein